LLFWGPVSHLCFCWLLFFWPYTGFWCSCLHSRTILTRSLLGASDLAMTHCHRPTPPCSGFPIPVHTSATPSANSDHGRAIMRSFFMQQLLWKLEF
jgi:hypothetical protein